MVARSPVTGLDVLIIWWSGGPGGFRWTGSGPAMGTTPAAARAAMPSFLRTFM
jgi:hypothetical protein